MPNFILKCNLPRSVCRNCLFHHLERRIYSLFILDMCDFLKCPPYFIFVFYSIRQGAQLEMIESCFIDPTSYLSFLEAGSKHLLKTSSLF